MNCTECGSEMIRGQSGHVCSNGCGRIHSSDPPECVVVMRPGTSVRFGDSTEGVVVSVMIEAAERLTYQVAYWIDRQRKTVWLDDFEVVPIDESTRGLALGFPIMGATR